MTIAHNGYMIGITGTQIEQYGGEWMFPNINAEMARNNLNNQSLADKLGVSKQTISNWRNGRCEIPASKLLQMSRLFGVTTDYLLGAKPQAT